MRIGFDRDTGHVYEGTGLPQFAVLPAPVLSQARLISTPEDWDAAPKGLFADPFAWVFREDSFDTVTRVRRGRLYQPYGNQQPNSVTTAGHPHMDTASHSLVGGRNRSLFTFMPCTELLNLPAGGAGQLLLIGRDRGVTAWRVIQSEVAISEDVIVTLKAQSAFGVLPELAWSAIPSEHRSSVKSAVDRVLDSAFRETPISLIDQCRNALSVVLSRWLVAHSGDTSHVAKDLGKLVSSLHEVKPPKECAAAVAHVVARLHSRGKSNEQTTKALRLPVEEDAELCLHTLGFVLRELGWAVS